MAILIKVVTEGGVVRRCDARCYNAEHPKCVCVCGGVNHGAGYRRAVENIREGKIDVPLNAQKPSRATRKSLDFGSYLILKEKGFNGYMRIL